MKTRILFFIPAILLCLFFALPARAHQPRIVGSQGTVEIKNPEVSQAFYGVLEGRAEYFKIESDKPFKLYLNLLVPDAPGAAKEVSAEVRMESGKSLFFLDGAGAPWVKFHEDFANDDYLKGPELLSTEVPAGVYDIQVYSPNNTGKYVLAVGEIEKFPVGETLNTVFILPQLKAKFFDKSPWSAFSNKIGLMVFGPIAIILGGLILLIAVVKFFVFLARREVDSVARRNQGGRH